MIDSVIYPGTFDPLTNGHLDIIGRSAVIFPHVLVAVANSPSKKTLLPLSERIASAQQAVAHLPNVAVFGFSDLLADVIKQRRIGAIIRGVRTTTDFEYELQLAALNKLLADGVETLILPPSEKWGYLSSTLVREIFLHGGDIAPLVPPAVLAHLPSISS